MFWRKPRDIEFGSPREKAKASIKRIDKYDSGQRFRITQSLALQILVLLTHWAVFTAFVLFCSAVIYWFYTAENASVWGGWAEFLDLKAHQLFTRFGDYLFFAP